MGSCGSCRTAAVGETCPSALDPGKACMTAFARGPDAACGIVSFGTCRLARCTARKSTGNCLPSTALSFGLTNRRLEPRKKKPAGEPDDHALGRSKGGFSTKLHLLCDGKGTPLAVAV